MAQSIHKQKDLIPLTLNVLDIVAYSYAGIAFKFAMRKQCEHLKVIRDHGGFYQFNSELLEIIDQKLIVMIESAIYQMLKAIVDMEKVYDIGFLKQTLNKRVTALAENFYEKLIDDEFPSEQEVRSEDYEESEYNDYLILYLQSLIRITQALIELLAVGAIDLASIRKRLTMPEHILKADYSGHLNAHAIGILFQLLAYLNNHLSDCYLYYFSKKEEEKSYEKV